MKVRVLAMPKHSTAIRLMAEKKYTGLSALKPASSLPANPGMTLYMKRQSQERWKAKPRRSGWTSDARASLVSGASAERPEAFGCIFAIPWCPLQPKQQVFQSTQKNSTVVYGHAYAVNDTPNNTPNHRHMCLNESRDGAKMCLVHASGV